MSDIHAQISNGSNTPPHDLLITKISKPIPREKLVQRSRLTNQLVIGMQGRLTTIVAPAGYGKTTLLGEWLARRDLGSRAVAWVSLDERDNDPLLFWSYIVAALRTIQPDLRFDVQTQMRQPCLSHDCQALNPLVNEISAIPKQLTLVLDDYQDIQSQAIHEAMTYLVDYLPSNMHLVIASRAEPPLNLARWRALGQIIEINADDLTFNFGETAVFLRQVMNLTVSISDISTLFELTEGWVTGLQLAAISMRGAKGRLNFVTGFTGSNRHIFDYLTGEVLKQQSTATVDFLLKTSILKRFCAPLCNALVDRSDSQECILNLEQMNLFIVPLDDDRCWFRYHALLADLLKKQLYQDFPEIVSELHLAACHWYRANGYPGDAIPHALAARNVELAADIVESCAMEAIIQYDLFDVVHWIDQLPDEYLLLRPRLSVYHALANILMGHLDEVEKKLQIAERAFESYRECQTSTVNQEFIIQVMLAVRASVNCLRGDYSQGISLALQALENLPEEDIYIDGYMNHILGYAYDLAGDLKKSATSFLKGTEFARKLNYPKEVVLSLSERARVLRMQGKLRESANEYERIIKIAQENEARDEFLILPMTGLGDIYVEWNDLELAGYYMRDALSYFTSVDIQTVSWVHSVILCSKLAKYKLALNDLEGANFFFQKANRSIQNYQLFTHLTSELIDVQVRLWLAVGDLVSASKWLKDVSVSSNESKKQLSLAEQTAVAKIQIELGEFDKARALLDEAEARARSEDRMESLIEILILMTRLSYASGESKNAFLSLIQALNLAEPEGYVGVFLLGGKAIRTLLKQVLNFPEHKKYAIKGKYPSIEYLEYLLRAFNGRNVYPVASQDENETNVISPLLEELSERELTVLKLIVDGKSTKEISTLMMISANTVKTHTKKIYRKLDVHNRKEAVELALYLRLIQ